MHGFLEKTGGGYLSEIRRGRRQLRRRRRTPAAGSAAGGATATGSVALGFRASLAAARAFGL